MFRLLREAYLTVKALISLIRDFFVKWFLPLHMEEEDAAEETSTRRQAAGPMTEDDLGYRGLLQFPDDQPQQPDESALPEDEPKG